MCRCMLCPHYAVYRINGATCCENRTLYSELIQNPQIINDNNVNYKDMWMELATAVGCKTD